MPAGQPGNPAEEPPPTPRVWIRSQSQAMLIGRRPDNHIVVSDLGVSKHHAELRRSPDGHYSIIDLGSHNGTYVNGTRISWHEPTELHEGDIITIGRARLRLADGELTEHTGDERPPG